MKPKIRMILFCAVMALLLPTLAVADNIYCEGTVDDLYVLKNGGVFAKGSWRGTWTQICNLEEEWKCIKTSTCFGWYNLLLTIQREGATGLISYTDTSQTCSSMPKYHNAEAPNYVMMR